MPAERSGDLRDNEHILYHEAQCTVRHLVEIGQQPRTILEAIMHTRPTLLTPCAVREAAFYLMLLCGGTTTLEVKTMLRRQGYRARQVEVSHLMRRLAAEDGWFYHDHGIFRTYHPAPLPDPVHGCYVLHPN